MLNVKLAVDHLYSKLLFIWLSLVMSFFPRDALVVLTGVFFLRIFSLGIFVSPHVCFTLDLILTMFLR